MNVCVGPNGTVDVNMSIDEFNALKSIAKEYIEARYVNYNCLKVANSLVAQSVNDNQESGGIDINELYSAIEKDIKENGHQSDERPRQIYQGLSSSSQE